MMQRRFSVILLLAVASIACEEKKEEAKQTTYDEALLAQYRAALPTESTLSAEAPEDGGATQAVGDAVLAAMALSPVASINATVTSFIAVLKAVVNLPPTQYNAEEKKFIWGPWPYEGGCGQFLVYIEDTEDEEDFRYNYAFLQQTDDGSAVTPVIFGAATPDASDPDRGVGITLWDFDEANEFTETCTGEAPTNPTAGRWVALYGDIDSDEDPNLKVQFNYSVFADFNTPDDNNPNASDLEIFYGNVENTEDDNTLQFIDFDVVADMCDADATDECFETNEADNVNETLEVTIAFLNEGTGRGEAALTGGDLGDAQGSVVECWNTSVEQTFLSVSDGTNTYVATGTDEATDCAIPFYESLATLGTPTLDDVPAELRTVINCIADDGVDAILEGTCE